jgi:uncharacterized membrane protein YphA (DoxX/SURF4 family)
VLTSFSLRSTFPVFPDGVPGFGLLLLRVTAGVALASSAAFRLVGWQEARVFSMFLVALSLICGLLLLVGLFNWLACGVTALIGFGCALPLRVPLLAIPLSSALLVAAIAIAVLCLGPGAYSLDARRHGRREIIIPARPSSSDDNPF